MFDKIIHVKLQPDYVQVLDNDILKTASEAFFTGLKFDPDFVYLLVRAISAGEYWGDNNNLDYFEEEELKKSHPTFMEAHVFKNHENKEVEKAIGSVLNSEWDDEMKCVMLVIRVDKSIAPTITRGLLTGMITDVSMGCRVSHVVCSYCGTAAKTRKDYCEHLRSPEFRGKVMSNGVKVVEINKEPKFHDISIVTKGADRTAKAFVVIDGAKGLEKAASFAETIEKVAQMHTAPEVPFTFQKHAFMKVAEIDKIIKGKILSAVSEEHSEEASDCGIGEDVFDAVRMLYTDYMNDSEIDALVARVQKIASKGGKTPLETFKTLLKTAELSGIELSPREFSRIASKLIPSAPDVSTFEDGVDAGSLKKIMNRIALEMRPSGKGTSIVISGQGRGTFDENSMLGGDPFMMGEMFKSIFAPMMPSRSFYPEHMTPRVIKIIQVDQSPNFSNLSHFALPVMGMTKIASEIEDVKIASAMYGIYQDSRVKLAMSGDFERLADEITGRGHEFVKVAMKLPVKTILAYPLFGAYSKYQQARMRNGENVGALNRFIAEDPNKAFFGAVAGRLLSKSLYNQAAKKLPAIKAKFQKPAAEVVDGAGDLIGKQAMETLSPIFPKIIEKTASGELTHDNYWFEEKIASEVDGLVVFNNPKINDEMLKTYTPEQVDSVKVAMVTLFRGDECSASEILKSASLTGDDILEYLHKSASIVKMDLEKVAEGLDLATDALRESATYSLFHPVATGLGAMSLGPGTLLDGALAAMMSRKAKKDSKVKAPVVEAPQVAQ